MAILIYFSQVPLNNSTKEDKRRRHSGRSTSVRGDAIAASYQYSLLLFFSPFSFSLLLFDYLFFDSLILLDMSNIKHPTNDHGNDEGTTQRQANEHEGKDIAAVYQYSLLLFFSFSFFISLSFSFPYFFLT